MVPLSDFQEPFLDPILALEENDCWSLLSPFTSSYVCAYIYDAPLVPKDAVTILSLCLERLLMDSTFQRTSYRAGEISGIHLPELVRTLMFISVDRADLAARFVNGDWTEINLILPLLDRFIRSAGWSSTIMSQFLTCCERAKANYPAEKFSDQIITIIGERPEDLQGWHGTSNYARIAELVQYFSHKNTPMPLSLAQKFLQILDILVDMGDRRSAALQLSEEFREIRLPL